MTVADDTAMPVSDDGIVAEAGPGNRPHANRSRLSPRDRRMLRATAGMWPLALIGPAITLLSVRFMVTVDGGGYIRLATLIRDGQMESWDFTREPGLPALVRITLLGPGAVPLYLLVSGLLVSLAVVLVGGIFYDVGQRWQRLVAGAVALVASIYISYAGMVAQQAGLAFLVAVLGWQLRFIQAGNGVKPLRFLALACSGTVSIYFAYVMAPTVVFTGLAAGIIMVVRMARTYRTQAILAAGLGILAALLPLVLYQPWQGLREAAGPERFSAGASLNGAHAGSVVSQIQAQGIGEYTKGRIQVALLLLHLREQARNIGDYDPDGWPSEDMIWANFVTWSGLEDSECGVFDVPAHGAWLSEMLPDYCQPVDGSAFWSAESARSLHLGGLASIGLVLGTLWAAFRRRSLLPVLAIPWLWVAMYSTSLAIDRYTIPIWPYKVVFSATLLLAVMGWLVHRLLRRFPDRWAGPRSKSFRCESAGPALWVSASWAALIAYWPAVTESTGLLPAELQGSTVASEPFVYAKAAATYLALLFGAAVLAWLIVSVSARNSGKVARLATYAVLAALNAVLLMALDPGVRLRWMAGGLVLAVVQLQGPALVDRLTARLSAERLNATALWLGVVFVFTLAAATLAPALTLISARWGQVWLVLLPFVLAAWGLAIARLAGPHAPGGDPEPAPDHTPAVRPGFEPDGAVAGHA